MTTLTLNQAAQCVKAGGVVAYPTEAVFGLGCDPFNESAVQRILQLKQRDVAKGLIVLISSWELVEAHTADCPVDTLQKVRDSWPGPHTWVLPNHDFPKWITGDHDGVALRMSAHPVAAALCKAVGGLLVSTSANVAGQAPMRDAKAVQAAWPTGLDGVVEGEVGDLSSPTSIRDARTGQRWRG